MRVLRHEPRHPAQPEARAEPVDEMRKLFRMVGRGEAGLRRIAAVGRERAEPDHVVAEAGIAFVADRRQPLHEQRADARGVAQRRAGAGGDAVHLAVGAEQRHLDQPRAFAAPLHQLHQFVRKMLDGAEHVGLERDRLGEAALRHERRHRQARRDRLVLAAERLVEPAHERYAEARGQRRARAVDDVGDMLQADLRELGDRLRRDPQRGERQRKQRLAGLLGEHAQLRAIARHRPCTAHGVGHRRARLKALGVEPRHDVAAQRLLAAEQMRAAGDVEEEPVGRIETDQRGVAVAPVGNRDQHAPVGIGIGVGDGDLRIHRARVGERHAGLEAKPVRRVVHAGEPQRALHRLDNDERVITRRGRTAAADQAIRHQPPQPYREIALAGGRRRHGDPNATMKRPLWPRRLRFSDRSKAVRPSPPKRSGVLGAEATCQRVVAAVATGNGRCRSNSPSAAAGARRECQSSRRREVGGLAGLRQFGDHDGDAARFQRLLAGPQRIDRTRHPHHDEPFHRQAEAIEPGAVRRAGFKRREVGLDEQRGAAARRTQRGDRQRETGRGAELRRRGGGQLMQRGAGQAAAEGGIDDRQAERQQFLLGKGKTLVVVEGCERLPEMAKRAAGCG